jgi:hypothetical protein
MSRAEPVADVREDAGYEPDPRPFEEQVESLARAAGVAPAATQDGHRPGLLAHEFIAKEFQAMSWRISDLVPGMGAGLIYGAYKAGKSLMGLQLSLCVSAGIQFMGRDVEQCPVLFVEEEGDPSALQTRIKTQSMWLGLLDQLTNGHLPLTIFHRERIRLDDAATVELLTNEAKESGARLIIIGPLSQVAAIKDENSAPEVNAIMRTINEVATAIDGTVLLVHHRRKDGQDGPPKTVEAFAASLRGSSALMGAVDAAIGIARDPEDTNGLLYVLLRDGMARKEHFTFDGNTLCIYPSDAPDKRKAPEADVLQDLRDNPWSALDKTAARLGVHTNTLRARLEQLIREDQATYATVAHGQKVYAVSGEQSEPDLA